MSLKSIEWDIVFLTPLFCWGVWDAECLNSCAGFFERSFSNSGFKLSNLMNRCRMHLNNKFLKVQDLGSGDEWMSGFMMDIAKKKEYWNWLFLIQNDIEATKCESPIEKCGVLVLCHRFYISNVGICDQIIDHQMAGN